MDGGSTGRGMERRRRSKVEGKKTVPGTALKRDRADPETGT